MILESDFTWVPKDWRKHPAWKAFVKEMKGHQYGREALTSAWHWFRIGFTKGEEEEAFK